MNRTTEPRANNNADFYFTHITDIVHTKLPNRTWPPHSLIASGRLLWVGARLRLISDPCTPRIALQALLVVYFLLSCIQGLSSCHTR